ncbi:AAA family ATPase, partial [Candidatus Liberibacter sp.]|uniref:AAA family ATPase n=1 Tax=Candidatus Liberibacter sp. TaxID=34022 RepID=UPI0015F6D0C1
WDAYDAVADGLNIIEFIRDCPKEKIESQSHIPSYSGEYFRTNQNPKPEDLISSSLLSPKGLMLLAGASKVGKSHIVLSMLINLSAGLSFLGFDPPRPLKVYYLQLENDFFDVRNKIQAMIKHLSPEQTDLFDQNFVATSRMCKSLTEPMVHSVSEDAYKYHHGQTDIIVVDPLYYAFDGGEHKGGENDSTAMIFFFKERLERLRSLINPNAGMILVHHTRKVKSEELKEIRFDAISGTSVIRRNYTSGMLLHKEDEDDDTVHVYFEVRSGERIRKKEIYYDKESGEWKEHPEGSIRLVNQNYGFKLDAERDRKKDAIIDIIRSEALKGNAYNARQFREAFDSKAGLGSEFSIHNRISVLMTKGQIQLFNNGKAYGLSIHHNAQGLLCVKDMELLNKGDELVPVFPTHYKEKQTGAILPVQDPKKWVEEE